MFKLYDLVKSKKAISEDIPVNTIGTVVMVYKEFTPVAYEIEFVNNNMETIKIVTLEEKDLAKLKPDSSDLQSERE